MPEDTRDESKTMERWAHKHWLQVLGRISMLFTTLVLVPITLRTADNLTEVLASIRKDILEIRLSLGDAKSQIANMKTLTEYQLRSFDDRLSAQSRRSDVIERRLDRLEEPNFRPRGVSGPTTP